MFLNFLKTFVEVFAFVSAILGMIFGGSGLIDAICRDYEDGIKGRLSLVYHAVVMIAVISISAAALSCLRMLL